MILDGSITFNFKISDWTVQSLWRFFFSGNRLLILPELFQNTSSQNKKAEISRFIHRIVQGRRQRKEQDQEIGTVSNLQKKILKITFQNDKEFLLTLKWSGGVIYDTTGKFGVIDLGRLGGVIHDTNPRHP